MFNKSKKESRQNRVTRKKVLYTIRKKVIKAHKIIDNWS